MKAYKCQSRLSVNEIEGREMGSVINTHALSGSKCCHRLCNKGSVAVGEAKRHERRKHVSNRET